MLSIITLLFHKWALVSQVRCTPGMKVEKMPCYTNLAHSSIEYCVLVPQKLPYVFASQNVIHAHLYNAFFFSHLRDIL
uniref:Putative secreted protein n=1 Tax=Rhipicephalus microplus TaxID=6941 RepID=A0A6M2DDW4_RHIMP